MYKKGFTLIEIVMGVTIFLIIALGIYEGYRGLFASLTAAHVRIVAASVVNERFEIVRNLPYTDVGIDGGVPSGVIPELQTIEQDGFTWDVLTIIENVDDPFDGVSPADTSPADYKLVEVMVSCPSCSNFDPVVVSGRVAPRNLEP